MSGKNEMDRDAVRLTAATKLARMVLGYDEVTDQERDALEATGFRPEDVEWSKAHVGEVVTDMYGVEWQRPLMLSLGCGKDSSTVLNVFELSGIRLDAIVFSDVRGEHPHTYKILRALDEWCRAHGQPAITVTTYYSDSTRYQSLEGNCLCCDGLPSLAYNKHSCSEKWKLDAIEDEIWGYANWEPGLIALRRGIKPTRMIGYDYGCADSKRFAKVDKQEKKDAAKGEFNHWNNRYPLREWKLSREDLDAELARGDMLDYVEKHTGERRIRKSSCFFCPASKVHEVEETARDYPDLALRIAVMEYRAETGKHGLLKINGLGLGKTSHPWDNVKGRRNWSWHRHLVAVGLLPENWKEIATEKGYIPAGWDAYVEEAAAYKQDVLDKREVERVAAEALGTEHYDVLYPPKKRGGRGKCSDAKRTKVMREVRGTPAGDAYVEAVWARKDAERNKKYLLSPDWRDAPQPRVPKDVKRQRRENVKRFEAAVAECRRIHAEHGEAVTA